MVGCGYVPKAVTPSAYTIATTSANATNRPRPTVSSAPTLSFVTGRRGIV